MAEARKSYMTKEQLESYLADLRTNKPQRPTGARPLSSAAKHRWSKIHSSTVPPAEVDEQLNKGPPTLVSPTPPPELSRRESKLLRKHSTASHKRSNTTGSILSIVRSPTRSSPTKSTEHKSIPASTEGDAWDGVDRSDGQTGDVAGPTRGSSMKKGRASGSFRRVSFSNLVGHGRSQSMSSGSSTSSGNSERKKRVSWKISSGERPMSPLPMMMPPTHPPKPEDAPKIEQELTAHFNALCTQSLPEVAPLRINKATTPTPIPIKNAAEKLPSVPETLAETRPVGERERACTYPGRREYGSPYPPRKEYVEPWKLEPTQHNKVQYTTNPESAPLPSPPMSDGEDAEAEILKDLGRRPLPKAGPSGPRGPTPPEDAAIRRNNTKYGAEVLPPPPLIIGTVTSPNPPPNATARVALNKTNTEPTSIPSISLPEDNVKAKAKPPAVPSINIASSPAVPTINIDGASERPRSTPVVPTISLPGEEPKSAPIPTINVPAVGEPSSSRNTTRPLPQPRPSPSVYSNAPPSATARNRGPTASCNLCRTPIEGRVVSAASLRFHPECFRCDHCHTSLEHVGFFPEPQDHRRKRLEKAGIAEGQSNGTGVRFYCHLDFHEHFSPRCKNCKTPIEGEVVVACGSTWHQGHFFCAECGDPFNSSSKFVEKDGYAWCVGCYTKRYSGKCKKCRQPVTETVVKALGGEWHEQCFVCTECSSTFDDGRFFVRGTEGREIPVCVCCEEKRLKA